VDKPVEDIIRHLPGNTSSNDITVALQELHYIISVKRMTEKRHTPEVRVTHMSFLSS
jgi:hypothetical protein